MTPCVFEDTHSGPHPISSGQQRELAEMRTVGVLGNEQVEQILGKMGSETVSSHLSVKPIGCCCDCDPD